MKKHFLRICLLALAVALLCALTGCRSDKDEDAQGFDSRTHYYMQRKGIGYCEKLTGDVHILFVWVDDAISAWNDSDKQTVLFELEKGIQMLETQAKAQNVELSFSQEYIESKIDIEAGEFQKDWKNEALVAAGYKSVGETQQEIEQKRGVSSAPIVFLLNCNGRAYAYSRSLERGAESVALYASDPSAFAHEILHLYGAVDLYVLDETIELAERLLPQSIMLYGDEIDDLTMYLIGWKTELTPAAAEFLTETQTLTAEYIDRKNKKDQHTGWGNIEWMGGTYKGEVVVGVPHGQGVLTFEDGSVYDGQWDGGYCQGEGSITWTDGSSYVGSWHSNYRHGKGVYTWADGAVYDGDWVEGRIEGKGKLSYPDGSCYDGEWKNDKWDGYGVYQWSDGTRYEGEWKEDYRCGEGKLTYSDGSCYEGEWEDDMRNGYGVFTEADGTRFEGNWRSDQKHGKGKQISPDGTVTEGRWIYGTLIE